MNAGIYCIKNTVTGDCYVGRSKNLIDRWKSHISALNNGKHHCRQMLIDWQIHGATAFEFKILVLCANRYRLATLEANWIMRLKPEYNLCWNPNKVKRVRKLSTGEIRQGVKTF